MQQSPTKAVAESRTTVEPLGWRVLLLVFTLALALRVAYVIAYGRSELALALIGDAETFDVWAQSIAGGDWLGQGAFFQAPLYPYLIAIVYKIAGHQIQLVQFLQAILGAASCALLAAAAAKSFGRRVGLLAGLCFAIYAPAIYYDALLEKTTLTVFLVVLLVHTLVGADLKWSAGRAFAAGLVLAAIALTRENAVLLVCVVVPCIWTRQREGQRARRVGQLAALAAGIVLVVAPVTARNRYVSGEFVFTTTNSGFNLFIGNHAGADGLFVPPQAERGHSLFESIDATELAAFKTGSAMSAAQSSAYWRQVALEWIAANPGQWIALTARKLLLLCNDHEWMDSQSYLVGRADSVLLNSLAVFARWGTLLPLTLLGLWIAGRPRPGTGLWYGSIALLGAGIVLFWILGRFRMCLVPLTFPFAASALLWIWAQALGASQLRNWRKLCSAGAILCGGSLLAFWPFPRALEYPFATSYANLGSALLRSGQTEAAVKCYERAIAEEPDCANPYLALGDLCSMSGELERARVNLAKALELGPDFATRCHLVLADLQRRLGDPAAMSAELAAAVGSGLTSPEDFYRAGLLSRELGRLEDARRAYLKAIELRPGFLEARNNLGFLLARTGAERESAEQFERALALDPNYVQALVNLLRLRATANDASVRDPRRASQLLQRAERLLGQDSPAARELRALIPLQ